jgi:hypothetical protein
MNPVEQDIERRKNEIVAEVNALFHANMKFTDWDVPEADNELAAKLIIEIMHEALDGLKTRLDEGEFK